MRIVLDTNVFVSGVFWKGPPAVVLDACSSGRIELVLSPAIIDEYRRVGQELTNQYHGLDLKSVIDALITIAYVVSDRKLPSPVCSDPDDDKFLAAAISSRAEYVVSGDKALLRVHEYRGVRVVTAREFVDDHLNADL